MACSIRFWIITSPRMTRAWLSATSRLSGGPMPLGPRACIAVLAHNTQGYKHLLSSASWSYRAGAEPNFALTAF